jgi:antirestriction protein ArdC
MATNTKTQIAYQKITDELISLVESSGLLPWHKPWNAKDSASFPTNFSTKAQYSGGNVWILMAKKAIRSYPTNFWVTYNQAKALKGYVKKGEKGTHVLRPIFRKIQEKDEDGNLVDKQIICGFAAYSVFNIAQTTLEAPVVEEDEDGEKFVPIEEAAEIVDGYTNKPPIFNDGGNKAYYSPMSDEIHVPKGEAFDTCEAYYGTLFHEIIHSTGHKTRLNRDGVMKVSAFFGSKDYSYEELVAEMGMCFLLSQAGILTVPEKENAAAYLKNWLKVLKSNPDWLAKASIEAQKATKYVLEGKKAPKPVSKPSAPVSTTPIKAQTGPTVLNTHNAVPNSLETRFAEIKARLKAQREKISQ